MGPAVSTLGGARGARGGLGGLKSAELGKFCEKGDEFGTGWESGDGIGRTKGGGNRRGHLGGSKGIAGGACSGGFLAIKIIAVEVGFEGSPGLVGQWLEAPGTAPIRKESHLEQQGLAHAHQLGVSDGFLGQGSHALAFFQLGEEGFNGTGWGPGCHHLGMIMVAVGRSDGAVGGF